MDLHYSQENRASLTVEDVGNYLNRVHNAIMQAEEFSGYKGDHIASVKTWRDYARTWLTYVDKAVNSYRSFCNAQPGRLEYLENTVTNWEKEILQYRKRLQALEKKHKI